MGFSPKEVRSSITRGVGILAKAMHMVATISDYWQCSAQTLAIQLRDDRILSGIKPSGCLGLCRQVMKYPFQTTSKGKADDSPE